MNSTNSLHTYNIKMHDILQDEIFTVVIKASSEGQARHLATIDWYESRIVSIETSSQEPLQAH